MKKLLYLLRQPVQRIPASLFLLAQQDNDVVFLEEAGSQSLASSPEQGFSTLRDGTVSGAQTLTYEELLEKIMSADRVVLI